MKRQFLTVAVWAVFGFLVVWAIILNAFGLRDTAWNYLFNAGIALLCVLGALQSLSAWRRDIQNRTGNHWLHTLFFAQFLSYALAFLSWTYANLVLRIDMPYPSLPDVFFIVFYILLIAGFFLFLNKIGVVFSVFVWFEMSAVGIGLFIVLYSFLTSIALDTDISALARIFNILYPAFDVILVSLAVGLLRTTTGSLNPRLLLLVFGFIGLAAADTIFSFRSSNELYWNGDISDVLFMITTFLLVVGVQEIDAIIETRSRELSSEALALDLP